MSKLSLVQVLRGLAALIVVLHHINSSTQFYLQSNWLNGFFKVGWFGVDFFFVLSGFIMFYIHHKDLENRTNVKLFFKKRFTRIFPIYWIIATIYLFFLISTGKLFFITDFSFIIKSYLLIPQLKMPFLFVAWSLVYECFFYLIFGLGLFFGLKIMKLILFFWITLIFLFSFFISDFKDLFLFNNFILEFLFGCIFGYKFVYGKSKFSINAKLIFFIGLIILIGISIITYYTDFFLKSSISSRLGYGIASSLLIYGAAIFNRLNNIKINKFYLLLGDASYTLYLIHPIVLGLAYKSTAHFLKSHSYLSDFFGFLVLIIAVIVGVFFHIYIEKKVIVFFSDRFSLKKKTLLD